MPDDAPKTFIDYWEAAARHEAEARYNLLMAAGAVVTVSPDLAADYRSVPGHDEMGRHLFDAIVARVMPAAGAETTAGGPGRTPSTPHTGPRSASTTG